MLLGHRLLWNMFRALRGRQPRNSRSPFTFLLTGTFYSENWILNHLRPLAASPACAGIWLVSNLPLQGVPRVQSVAVPGWLSRLFGQTAARLLVFVLTAVRRRPDFVGGFHLLVNALVASLVARLLGSRSLYFCGGGPLEVLGGGFYADNRLFDLLTAPDPCLERQLIHAVDGMDLVVTMGYRTIDFFRDHGVQTRFEVVPGGIDAARYRCTGEPKTFDLIFVGQLIPVKRVDLFLETVKLVAAACPSVTAVIVGTGRLEESLKEMAGRLGVRDRVTFAGYQADVVPWLHKSKVLALTSDSEGLSLAVMEAMLCGLPCIVSDVGEMRELVRHDLNGYVIGPRDASSFAEYACLLLSDHSKRSEVSEAARTSAASYETSATAERWTALLTS
jgi:glycosyltransferase involved in cell wall biosynthesis